MCVSTYMPKIFNSNSEPFRNRSWHFFWCIPIQKFWVLIWSFWSLVEAVYSNLSHFSSTQKRWTSKERCVNLHAFPLLKSHSVFASANLQTTTLWIYSKFPPFVLNESIVNLTLVFGFTLAFLEQLSDFYENGQNLAKIWRQPNFF